MSSNKLWGGRFTSKTDSEVEAYTASIHFDCALVKEDILGSIAHAAMLAKCEIIKHKEFHLLKSGLQKLAKKVEIGEVQFHTEDEDIHMNIERLLHEDIGEVAGKLHTARSRNDQVALDLHLYVRNQLINIVELIALLQSTFVQLAKSHRDILLSGYTHLQRAQPIFLASHWLTYAAMLQRDCERFMDMWKRVNQSPLGAGALSGSSFAIDRHYTAELLGFDSVYSSKQDAVSDRDFVIEFVNACALLMMHLSRLSEELILWSSQEFNFITLSDAFCTGSSIMPQKKNPDIAELARGKTGRVYGALFSLLTIMKGLPLAYNRDMQEDKEPLFDTVKTSITTLKVYIPLLSSMQINAKNMLKGTEDGFINATALAEYLVKKDIPFRHAHEIVGKIVQDCIENGMKLEALTLPKFQEFSPHFASDIFTILDTHNVAASNDRGTHEGNSQLEKEIANQEKQLLFTEDFINQKKGFIHGVEASLLIHL